jgi:bacterioferritin-associated ferredoxin
MIVCSCNRLSDRDVRGCCAAQGCAPARVMDIYTRLGCAPQCGRCAPTLAAIMREARDPGCACGPTDCPCATQAENMQAA